MSLIFSFFKKLFVPIFLYGSLFFIMIFFAKIATALYFFFIDGEFYFLWQEAITQAFKGGYIIGIFLSLISLFLSKKENNQRKKKVSNALPDNKT